MRKLIVLWAAVAALLVSAMPAWASTVTCTNRTKTVTYSTTETLASGTFTQAAATCTVTNP